jgi:hypothetical protein
MRKFVDGSGKEWPIVVSVGLLEDVERDHGVSLEAAFLEGGQTAAETLYSAPRQLASIMATLCQVPADQVVDFRRRMGRAELDRARTIVLEAISDFCLPPKVAEKYSLLIPQMLAGGAAEANPGSNGATNSPVSPA